MRKKKPKIESSVSIQPESAQLRPDTGAKRFAFDSEKWKLVQNSIYTCWQQAISDRAELDQDLATYNAIYEMQHSDADGPWEGASNVIPPIVPAELESVRDFIVQAVFTPRLFMVKGRSKEAIAAAPQVEAWLNDLLYQDRGDEPMWIQTLLATIQASLRDGTSSVLVTWFQEKTTKRFVTFEPELDAEGDMVLDEDNQPKKKRKIVEIKDIVDEPRVELVTRKNLTMSPATAKNPQKAAAVFVTRLMYEEDLNKLLDGMGDDPESGAFSREAVDIVLSYVEQGIEDVPSDPQGTYDIDAGGQLQVSGGQGSMGSPTFKNRGRMEFYVCFSKQHDMNDDGRPEWNIFFLHGLSQQVIGWMPYEYLLNKWPIASLSCFPRVDQFDGYSIPERIVDEVDSLAAAKNQRINYDDLCVNPERLRRRGANIDTKENAFGPGVEHTVEEKDDLSYLMPPPSYSNSFQENVQDLQFIGRVTGQGSTFSGGKGSTKESATEAKIAGAAQSTRSNTIALWVRFFMHDFINIVFKLYLGCSNDDPEYMDGSGDVKKLPRELLALPYRIEVAGIADPTNEQDRQNQTMMAVTKIAQVYPARFSKPSAQFEAARAIAETFPNFQNLDKLLGTAEDAKALDQAMAQQAQAQAVQQQGGQAPQQGVQGG